MNQELKNEFEEPSLNDLLRPFIRRWVWFVVSVFLLLTSSYVYLRYTAPKYETKATVLVKDRTDNGLSSDLDPFKNLGIFKRFSKGKLENELAILNSRRIISKVIEKLDFNVKYEVEGRVITNEVYPNSPIKAIFTPIIDGDLADIPKLKVTIVSNTDYELSDDSEIYGVFNFGEKASLPMVDLLILPNDNFLDSKEPIIGKTIIVSYRETIALALAYQEKMEIINDVDNSNVVSINIQSTVKRKSEDFIDELVRQYNLDAAEDQNAIAIKTSEFIDSRIKIIIKDLDSVEINKQKFKTKNKLTNIEAESQIVLTGATEFSNKQVEFYTKIVVMESMLKLLEDSKSIQLLPANIGVEEGDLTNAVNYYNQLVLERNRLLRNSTSQNPIVINIENQIIDYRASIINSLSNKLIAFKIALKDINKQENKFNSRLSKVPEQEKYFREIVRQQEIKEQLYIFLLKQREEASIKLATTTLKAKVIDVAYSSKDPITPNKRVIYMGASLIGLLIPFLIIYSRNLLNTRVENRKDIERELKGFSLIGEIPIIKKVDDQIIRVNDRSVLAESFRILRTNLQYFFINKVKDNESKAIFVTSTIKGEGKTLTAFNLALTLSYSGNKVALVGADIRNPQLQRYLPKEDRKHQGLTEFIVDSDLGINEVIVPSEFENVDIVLSGVIPPNPAELLLQDRVGEFFKELKEIYDYIIVDTAPSMLVTDTFLISKYSDIMLYVIKANHTDKKLLEFPNDAVKDGKLKNVALVLNGVSMNNFGYGNKYGYAYSKEKPSFKERFFGL